MKHVRLLDRIALPDLTEGCRLHDLVSNCADAARILNAKGPTTSQGNVRIVLYSLWRCAAKPPNLATAIAGSPIHVRYPYTIVYRIESGEGAWFSDDAPPSTFVETALNNETT